MDSTGVENRTTIYGTASSYLILAGVWGFLVTEYMLLSLANESKGMEKGPCWREELHSHGVFGFEASRHGIRGMRRVSRWVVQNKENLAKPNR